ncbi:TPA: oligoendopeptidase F, partial [Streptococcus pyogenes]|nr:oligoendopeptidase F [Streptococcus pyogenes]
HGTQDDIDHYLAYLKSGNSDYPLEVIAKAGVDMEKGDYLEAAFKVFDERLTELEVLVSKGIHKS